MRRIKPRCQPTYYDAKGKPTYKPPPSLWSWLEHPVPIIPSFEAPHSTFCVYVSPSLHLLRKQILISLATDEWDSGAGCASSWNDNAGSAAIGEAFGAAGGDNFDGGFSSDVGGDADGPADGSCRRCGVEGHFAKDCDQPRVFSGACFNCGEEGHSKAEVY